jgi:acetylornithine deacetylase/succinyl-diaminopimelate desuccinylase-like protein
MINQIIELAKKLIAIPSYVSSDVNERAIGEFVFTYLKKNYPWLRVQKQIVKSGRFNIVATDGYPVKIIICGHLDTVNPGSAWRIDPLKPFVKDNRLYGLGATDMKGSLAALLIALKNFSQTKGLLLLFYVDEEYNFVGMRKFISSYRIKDEPSLILSIDGGDLKITTGCRGLVDLDFEVVGKAGHAALPLSGKNALLAATNTMIELARVLKKDFSDPILGPSVCNLAILETDNQGRNVIPGQALAKIDVRPARADLKGKKLVRIIRQILRAQKSQLGNFRIINDLGPMIPQEQGLKEFDEIVKAEIGRVVHDKPKDGGYVDCAMLYEKYQAPIACFGPGPLKMAHRSDEYVYIGDLKKCAQVFAGTIKRYCA